MHPDRPGADCAAGRRITERGAGSSRKRNRRVIVVAGDAVGPGECSSFAARRSERRCARLPGSPAIRECDARRSNLDGCGAGGVRRLPASSCPAWALRPPRSRRGRRVRRAQVQLRRRTARRGSYAGAVNPRVEELPRCRTRTSTKKRSSTRRSVVRRSAIGWSGKSRSVSGKSSLPDQSSTIALWSFVSPGSGRARLRR